MEMEFLQFLIRIVMMGTLSMTMGVMRSVGFKTVLLVIWNHPANALFTLISPLFSTIMRIVLKAKIVDYSLFHFCLFTVHFSTWIGRNISA